MTKYSYLADIDLFSRMVGEKKWICVQLTLFSPFIFFRHIESSSLDSSWARIQWSGGCWYLNKNK
jgi:hypothetical protein